MNTNSAGKLAVLTCPLNASTILAAVTKCKVKLGLPFARPGLQHPKTVGAAKIVPNNRLKHPYAPPLTPDLTKDRPLVWPAHIPQPPTVSVANLDSTQRRQAAPRLHCRAFEFPADAVVSTFACGLHMSRSFCIFSRAVCCACAAVCITGKFWQLLLTD